VDLPDWWRDRDYERKEAMTTAIVRLSGIALFVGIITAMDLWTQRQDRRNGSAPKNRT
jgi:hypothetical protein